MNSKNFLHTFWFVADELFTASRAVAWFEEAEMNSDPVFQGWDDHEE
jgi:hypothetical protein